MMLIAKERTHRTSSNMEDRIQMKVADMLQPAQTDSKTDETSISRARFSLKSMVIVFSSPQAMSMEALASIKTTRSSSSSISEAKARTNLFSMSIKDSLDHRRLNLEIR
jgi:hypothetical protein